MKLISLSVERFAGLRDQKVSFGNGVNLFYGENESGKSSLCECLLFVFYGLENKAGRTRFLPWDADDASASLVVEKDGKQYRIERTVTRAGVDTHRIIDCENGEVVFAEQEAWEVFLQIPQVLYRRSAFIGQNDTAKIDGKPMESAIENLLIAADETVDTQKAIKRLDDARIPLLYKRKNGGRIFRLQQERERLQAQLHVAQQSQSDLLQQEHLLLQLQKDLVQNEENTKEQTELLSFWEEGKRRSAFLQLNSKEKQASDALGAKEAWEATYRENDFFPDVAYINRLKSFQAPLAAQRAKVQELNDACGELEVALRKADVDTDGLQKIQLKKEKKRHRLHAICVVTWVVAVLLLAASFLMPLSAPSWARTACMAGAVVILFGSLFLLAKAHKVEKELELLFHTWGRGTKESFQEALSRYRAEAMAQQSLRNEYNALLLQKDAHVSKLQELEQTISQELGRWGKTDLERTIEAAEFAFSRYITLTHKAELAESELRGYQVLVPVSEEDILYFRNSAYDFERFERLSGDDIRAQLSALAHEKDSLISKKQACELTLAALRATLHAPAELEEEMLRLQKEEAHLQYEHDALCLASDAICAARDKIRDGLAPHLTEKAGELMARFTGGRYRHLQISREFAVEYAQEKDARTHADSYFSAGTSDAAYFSIRLALAQVLFPEPLPLILDESFCRIDDSRYQNILQMLSEFCSDEQQILLFTSQKRDAELAKGILSSEPITL